MLFFSVVLFFGLRIFFHFIILGNIIPNSKYLKQFQGFGAPATSAPAFGGFNTATTSAATGLGGTSFGGFGATAPTTSGNLYRVFFYIGSTCPNFDTKTL